MRRASDANTGTSISTPHPSSELASRRSVSEMMPTYSYRSRASSSSPFPATAESTSITHSATSRHSPCSVKTVSSNAPCRRSAALT